MQPHAPLSTNPQAWFALWWSEAQALPARFPNAVVLATAQPNGTPSSRVVLIKDFSNRGFTFFTNYESNKAHDLAANPHAALTFYWDALGRQVHARGTIEKVSRQESEEYFASRPRGSQLGAWASTQSKEIPSREALLERLKSLDAQYPDEVPCPEHWGGYLLKPTMYEFWTLQEDRLHDRFRFDLSGNTWKIMRLAP